MSSNAAAHAFGPTESRPRKRARTAVACGRCKSRKQKCDGVHPTCSNCASSESICEYDLSPSLSRSQEQYLRAQRRVAELEGILGRLGEAQDQTRTNDSSPSETSSPELTDKINGTKTAPMPSLCSPQSERRSSSVPDSASNPHAFVNVLRHLSLQATGGYVDSSSTVTLGSMLQSMVEQKLHNGDAASGSLLERNLSPKSLDVVAPSTGTNKILLSVIPNVIADRMLEKGYFGYIAKLWPLMYPDELRKLHEQRANLDDRVDIATLHLVYATAGRFLETTGETGSFKSEQHYQVAATLLPEILNLHDIRSVQTLLLLAIYSLRAPKGPGAWSFVGMAMRMCIELGLHRTRRDGVEAAVRDEELRRRVFWSCYCLDRQVSIILGRPFAIHDNDVDVELPASADDSACRESTACFVRICRLRIIESQIQQTVYRVDKASGTHSPLVLIQSFMEQLEQWRSDIPSNDDSPSLSPIDNSDSYLIYYYQAVRFLLHPHISSPYAQDQYLKSAVVACGGICQTYKRLHQNVTVGFSLMALHAVFFAGVELLYCAWKLPSLLFTNSTRNMINDCSIVLYIITERWPGAKRYRDLFESIKDPVLCTIEQHENEPQRAVKQLQPDVHGALRSIHPGHDEFSAMLLEMAGGTHAASTFPQPQRQQQYDTALSANDPSLVPGLAFDFSLPTNLDALPPFHPSLNHNFYDWHQDLNATVN